MSGVELERVEKRYGAVRAVKGIDLVVADGEFVVLVGPSGCGKSTTLRMIAGLEDISAGTIRIGGRVVNRMEPKERNIAMVFQNYAIYPHMSVARNIGFGLHTAKLPQAEKDRRIRATAELLGLVELLDRRPAQLSGGQRQRVAIGRAMVREPVAFLFDEPLSNLDAQLRSQMRLEIKKLHQSLGRTILFVTHDQVEAMTLADRIVVMRDGEILQTGTPHEVYREPADTFVARFIGAPSMNLVPARIEGGRLAAPGLGTFPAPPGLSGELQLGIRADDLRVAAAAPVKVAATVRVVEPLGPDALLYVESEGRELVAKSAERVPPRPGETVSLGLYPGDLHVFDATSGRALRHGL